MNKRGDKTCIYNSIQILYNVGVGLAPTRTDMVLDSVSITINRCYYS